MKTGQALIVGAGLCGATIARSLAERNWRVLVLEKRWHVAGNAYDQAGGGGVLVQKYGAHLFHTDDAEVLDFLGRFAEFYPYRHRVRASIGGSLVPVPFQFAGIRELFPPMKASRLLSLLKARYRDGERVPIMALRQNEDPDIRELAEFIYENVFRRYTAKQWGKSLDELDSAVGERVPVLMSESDGYFSDAFQCMPRGGFTRLVERMLGHPAIDVRLRCDAMEHLSLRDGRVFFKAEKVEGPLVFTGCVDELLGFCFGKLPYRSLRFVFQDLEIDRFQPCGVVNYTVSEEYTRILEFKHFMEEPPRGRTTVAYEYPCGHDGSGIPFYPVTSPESAELYKRYREKLAQFPGVLAAGRLGAFKYLNMDQAVRGGLETAKLLGRPE